MQPTLFTGDILLTNKMAYDFKFPFIGEVMFRVSSPKKGDVVTIYTHQKKLVKRIIGLPGDKLKIENKIIFINGKPINRVPLELSAKQESDFGWSQGVNYKAFIEQNGQSEYKVLYANDMHLKIQNLQIENIEEIKIPENRYFVLGDNRITSRDSRSIGLVNREDIIGKTYGPILSLSKLFFWE